MIEYTEVEQKQIQEYWTEYFFSKFSNLPFDEQARQASVHSQCEINGFGRKLLKKSIRDKRLKDCINQYFSNFEEYKNEGKGVFLFGTAATGKTLAATILAKNVLMIENPYNLNSFSIRFFFYDDLVHLSYDNKEYKKLDEYTRKPDILVLDNLGSESGLNTQGKSSVVLLENILRNRDSAEKMTWITSTLPINKIESIYSKSVSRFVNENFYPICTI